MIEMLGASAINNLVSAGLKEFISLMSNKPSRAYGDVSGRIGRAYTTTRGILISREEVEKPIIDFNKGYKFQFNPETISDIKDTLWEQKPYTGLPYSDYIWAGGGDRTISFQLFLDNTPQSKTRQFRPEEMNGSKLASEIKTKGVDFTYDDKGRITGTDEKNYFMKSVVDDIVSEGKTMASSLQSTFTPGKGPTKLEFTPGPAYSKTRIDRRGILPEVELIQSFLYPVNKDDCGELLTPLFASGGIVDAKQFRPPAVTILCVGPLYLQGHVSAAPVQYTLFDEDLTPLRATIDVEFVVYEYEALTNKLR